MLQMTVRGKSDGVMVPTPQYPVYAAEAAKLGATMVNYYLDEAKGWAITAAELDKAAAKAKAGGLSLRCIFVVNPGNPTGQVLTEECIKEVITWAGKNGVLILADEVYQSNVYDPTMKFNSFKKVLRSMPEYATKVELVSFHSVSKGVFGEGGARGGYMELVNLHQGVLDEIYKTLSVGLCSNLPGQVVCDTMVNEPKPGDASYAGYKAEHDKIFESLKRKALKLVKCLNGLEGYSCTPSSGAMYAFPQIKFPKKFIDACKGKGMPADTQYCMDLLNATGICVAPGSDFGQVEGTYHFRMSFLPEEGKMDGICGALTKFHAEFMTKYK
jgi:aspartate/methionine/tyrosine aminotransferase